MNNLKKVRRNFEKKLVRPLRQNLSKEELLVRTTFLNNQFKQHVSTAIIAAFSFILALVWKDLIVYAADYYVKDSLKDKLPYFPDLITAIVVSIFAVIGILIVSNWAKKPANSSSLTLS